jgi:hypothetical protein
MSDTGTTASSEATSSTQTATLPAAKPTSNATAMTKTTPSAATSSNAATTTSTSSKAKAASLTEAETNTATVAKPAAEATSASFAAEQALLLQDARVGERDHHGQCREAHEGPRALLLLHVHLIDE